MVASGDTTAILAGLHESVFQRSGDPLPPDFTAYPSFIAHAAHAVLLGLIALHPAAALGWGSGGGEQRSPMRLG